MLNKLHILVLLASFSLLFGANPVQANGQQTMVASWYGPGLQGNSTANGERFNMNELTAAHRSLPFGTRLRITYPATGKSVVVRINDRGPYIHGRDLDLSRAAAARIGLLKRGHGTILVSRI